MTLEQRRQRARRLNDDEAPDTVEKNTDDEVDSDDLDYSGVVSKADDSEEARERREEFTKSIGSSAAGIDFEEVYKGDREEDPEIDYSYDGITQSSEEKEREKDAAAIGEAVADELAARGLADDGDGDADPSADGGGSVEKAGETTADLLDDVRLLKRWVKESPESRPTRIGERVPTLVVPEFAERGVPHVHVVFVGVGWVARHSALSRYWSESRDRAEVVHYHRLQYRGGRWRWNGSEEDRDHPDVRGRTPREYLREGIDLLSASAEATAAEVQGAADALRRAGRDDGGGPDEDALDRGRDLWRVALRWTTDLPVFTASPELKPEDGGKDRATMPVEPSPHEDTPPRWRYIGTARLGEFPRSIRENATVVRRGPGPPSGRPPPSDGENVA
jgi:hypothetical protein